jgi:hypothetical protein
MLRATKARSRANRRCVAIFNFLAGKERAPHMILTKVSTSMVDICVLCWMFVALLESRHTVRVSTATQNVLAKDADYDAHASLLSCVGRASASVAIKGAWLDS